MGLDNKDNYMPCRTVCIMHPVTTGLGKGRHVIYLSLIGHQGHEMAINNSTTDDNSVV